MSSIAEIQRATAAHFGLSREELLCPDPSRRYAWPRQIGMAIAREHGHSFLKIGRIFGRHHTTVLHATRAVAERRDAFASDMAAIRADLARYTGVLVDVEKKARAARSIGVFCAAFGAFLSKRASSSKPFNTGTRGTRGQIPAREARQPTSSCLPMCTLPRYPRALRASVLSRTFGITREG